MMYGHRIAALREKRKWTQEELSRKLGISRAALSHYEKNRREPDYDNLKKLADVFQVSVDYLIGRTNDPEMTLDDDISQFADQLELADEEVLEKFSFTVDGRKLTKEEAKRFIAFVRAERSINQ